MDYYRKEGTNLKPAPMTLEENGRIISAPTQAEYARHGCYPYRPATPERREGYTARVADYEVSNGALIPVWAYDEIPETPVTYSKRKFMLAAANAGVYASIKAWMEATEIIEGSGLTAWELLSQSQFLRTDDAEFIALRAAAVAEYGEERVAQILEASVDEEA